MLKKLYISFLTIMVLYPTYRNYCSKVLEYYYLIKCIRYNKNQIIRNRKTYLYGGHLIVENYIFKLYYLKIDTRILKKYTLIF